jgi:WhiB family redox-sensing transcriptional regulator
MAEEIKAPGAWRFDGACCDYSYDLWFPETENTGRRGGAGASYHAKVRQAKAICATCPVLADCADYIAANPQQGIWAGTTERERREARRAARP